MCVCARRCEASWTVGANGTRAKDGQELVLRAYEALPQPQNKETLQLVAQQWAKIGVKLNVLTAMPAARPSTDPAKTAVFPTMVGRADPDLIKSQYYPTHRNVLLQKDGVSDKVKSFEDTKLNALLDGFASEIDPAKRPALVGKVQNDLIDQAYVIPIFEEPQAFAGAPWVKDVSYEAVGRLSFYSIWLTAH